MNDRRESDPAVMLAWCLMIVVAVIIGVVIGAWITRGIAGAAHDVHEARSVQT